MIIALIDDSFADNILLKNLIGSDHVTVHYSSLGSYIYSIADHDLVICDYNMPDNTSENIEAAIEKNGKNPFVLYTGADKSFISAGNLDYYKKSGICEIFQKGKDDKEIVQYIEGIASEA